MSKTNQQKKHTAGHTNNTDSGAPLKKSDRVRKTPEKLKDYVVGKI